MTEQPGSDDPGFAAVTPANVPVATTRSSGGNGLLAMRIIGWLMFAYGALMLVLLFTGAKPWALEHSIAALVSTSDRRVGNTVQGAVDEPIAIAGSVVVMFAGLWFALLVPWIMNRSRGKMEAMIEESQRARGADGQSLT